MKVRLGDCADEEDGARKRVVRFDSEPAVAIEASHVGAGLGDLTSGLFDPVTGMLPTTGFTTHMQRNVPRADGRPGSRDPDAPYGYEWVKENELREFMVRRNLFFRFAMQASSNAGFTTSLWSGTEGKIEGEALANLIQSATANEADQPSGSGSAASLPRSIQQDVREALEKAQSVVGADKVELLQINRFREEMEAAAVRRGVDPTDPEFLASAGRALAEEQRRNAPIPSPSMRPGPSSSALLRGTVPAPDSSAPAVRPPADADGVELQAQRARSYHVLVNRDTGDLTARTPPADTDRDRRAEEQERTAAAEKLKAADALRKRNTGSLATIDSEGKAVYDVTNKWAMALHLMLNKPTAPQIELWREMFDHPKRDTSQRSAAAVASRKPPIAQVREILNEYTAVQSILGRGQGNLGWTRAAQNVGHLYFSPVLLAGINNGVDMVRGPMCADRIEGPGGAIWVNKTWVSDLDLMTHDRVWMSFAQMVGVLIRINQMAGSRYSNNTDAIKRLEIQLEGLQIKFRDLYMAGDDFLGFRGQVNILGEAARYATQERRLLQAAASGSYPSSTYDIGRPWGRH